MEDIYGQFAKKKRDDSPYLTLADSESTKILKVTDMKIVNKQGFDGKEKTVLRLTVDVNTDSGIRSKDFDNATAKFALALKEAKVTIGSSFNLMRVGQGPATRYIISEVKNPTTEAVVETKAPNPLE